MNKELTLYERWLQERKDMLNRIPEKEREKIELELNIFLANLFKDVKTKGDQGFSYDPILNHPHIKKHFPIIATAGDRNIGKTTSSKKRAREMVANRKRFMILRNIQEEVTQQVVSDSEVFLSPCNGEYVNKKTPTIMEKDSKEIVGGYRDINTIGKFKSIEFPNVGLMIYEEYNTDVMMNNENKGRKFSEFITTVQRHNPDLQIIMQANFVDQDDQMLQKLGVGLENLNNRLCVINGYTGAIVIFIPKGIYKSTSDDINEKAKYIGYRTALVDFETGQRQYGGQFLSHDKTNIINETDIGVIEKVEFNLAFAKTTEREIVLTLYKAYMLDGSPVNYFSTKMGDNAAPTLVFDPISELRYINAHRLDINSLESLINSGKNDDIKTSSTNVYNLTLRIFAEAKKVIEKEEFEINEIPDYV